MVAVRSCSCLEIKARGYPGSYDTVARYARRFRQAQERYRGNGIPLRSCYRRCVSLKTLSYYRVVQHIWCCSDRNYENHRTTVHHAAHPELTGKYGLAQSLPSLYARQNNSLLG